MVSVIIPTLNEQRALPATLDSLLYQTGVCQVIVCDGSSADDTVSKAEQYRHYLPNLQVIQAARGRASQMNAGAAVADGEWLLFLHADTLLPVNGLAAIGEQQAKAGIFTHRFSGEHTGLRIISALHNWRFRRTGIMYGDQGIFVRAEVFRQLGGFPEEDMEDIRFSEKLLRVTRPIQLPETVITDSRKFLQIGVWRAFWWVCVILWRDCFTRKKFGRRKAKPDFFAEYR